MSLSATVELYRLCERPDLDGHDFAGTVQTDHGRDLVEAIRQEGHGRFVDLVVDGNDWVTDDPIPQAAGTIQFTLRLPQGSANTFHQDLGTFLERAAAFIGRGKIPEDFYLVEEDYYSAEDEPFEGLRNLRSIAKLIQSLAELAYYRHEYDFGYYLVFLQPDGEAMPKPVELKTFVNSEIVGLGLEVNTQLVDELARAEAEHDPHYSARVGVFGTALAQFVSGFSPERGFRRLIENWDAFARAYQQDLSTYLSGFAFHKARREVSKAELDLASRLSAVLTDIAGKILGVPISMVAVVAMTRVSGFPERLLLLIGIGVASLLLVGAVRNQQAHLDRVVHAKKLTLDAVEGRRAGFPDELREEVEQMTKHLDRDERRLRLWLRIFFGLSLLPVAAGLLVMVALYW